MKCICVKKCFGAGGANKRFKVGDVRDFDICPSHFKPVVTAPVAKPVEEDPVTLTALQEENEEAEAAGRPTEDELNGEKSILEE